MQQKPKALADHESSIAHEMTSEIILYLTDAGTPPSSYSVTRAVANDLGAVFTSLSPSDSAGRVVDLVGEASVVVAHIVTGSGNLFYEIGVAHGYQRPVVVLAAELAKVPFDLRAVEITEVPATFDEEGGRHLRFRLESTIGLLLKDPRAVQGYAAPVRSASQVPIRKGQVSLRTAQLERARERGFAHWVRFIASSVDGWDVVAPQGEGEEGYDLAVWNNLKDPSLSILGNPLLFEVKSAKVTAQAIRSLTQRVEGRGLKSIILLSRQPLNAASRRAALEIYKHTGVLPVLLDRHDLENVDSGGALIDSIARKVQEFRSV